MEKILVLGSTGNIGKAVLQALQKKQLQVFAGVKSEEDFALVSALGGDPIVVDFTNQDSLNLALKGKDRVFLVTPLMQHPEHVTEMVVHAARLNGLRHFVRSTASGADSKGAIQMARWAGDSEDILKSSGLNYTILRPASFLQNFIQYHGKTIREYNGFYLPNGNAKLAMLDIQDLGELAAIALSNDEHFGKTYDLSGLIYSNEELAETLSKVLGKKISYIDVSEEQAKESMESAHMPAWIVNAMMELNYIIKQGWAGNYSGDFRAVTGKEYTDAEQFFTRNRQQFM